MKGGPVAPIRLYTGAEAVRAADVLRQIRENQENWPYVHCFPPKASTTVERKASLAVPVAGAANAVTVLTYKVPAGTRFILDAVWAVTVGAATYVPGSVLWTLTLNQDPTATASVQASNVQDLSAVDVNLGSWLYGVKYKLSRALEFKSNDVLRWRATNVSYGAGAPNFLTAGLFGWLVATVEK